MRAWLMVVLAGAMGLAGPALANLLMNPGFETGDFSGWDAGGWYAGTGADAHSGTYGAAYWVPSGRSGGDYYVMLQYVPVSAGLAYDASAWLRTVSFNQSEAWLEVVFHDSTGGWVGQFQAGAVTGLTSYTQYSLNNLTAPVGSVTASVRAVVHTTANTTDNAWYTWDDFSMTQTIPEPTTLGLVGAGVMLMAAMKCRRNR